jgi:hypothetical protein
MRVLGDSRSRGTGAGQCFYADVNVFSIDRIAVKINRVQRVDWPMAHTHSERCVVVEPVIRGSFGPTNNRIRSLVKYLRDKCRGNALTTT